MEEERRLILEMLESGKITAEEGLRLIQALAGDEPSLDEALELPDTGGHAGAATPSDRAESVGQVDAPQGGPDPDNPPPAMETIPADAEKWRSWWVVPLWVGVAITVLAGLMMALAQQSAGIGFWFYCAWAPLLIGLALIVLAWQSRTARWIHLRIYQKPGAKPEKVAISFPIPVGLTAWFLRAFRGRIPGFEKTSLDELVLALDQETGPDKPFYVEVQDEEDGERIEVFIG